jgi:hypothetical protein
MSATANARFIPPPRSRITRLRVSPNCSACRATRCGRSGCSAPAATGVTTKAMPPRTLRCCRSISAGRWARSSYAMENGSGGISSLERHFRLPATQRDPQRADSRLWPWCRVTAWRVIKRVMRRSAVSGRQLAPEGFATPSASAHYRRASRSILCSVGWAMQGSARRRSTPQLSV